MYQTESSLPSLRCSKREKSWEFFGTLWFSKQGETILWRAGEEAIGDRQSGQWKVINFDMITALCFRPILLKLAVVSSLRLFLPIRRLQATALESRRDVSGIHFRRGQCYDDAQWAVCILRPVTFKSNCSPVWVLPRLMILGSFRGNGTPDLWGACDKLRGATDSVPLLPTWIPFVSTDVEADHWPLVWDEGFQSVSRLKWQTNTFEPKKTKEKQKNWAGIWAYVEESWKNLSKRSVSE